MQLIIHHIILYWKQFNMKQMNLLNNNKKNNKLEQYDVLKILNKK